MTKSRAKRRRRRRKAASRHVRTALLPGADLRDAELLIARLEAARRAMERKGR